MAVAREKEFNYSEGESVNQISTTIYRPEYSELEKLDEAEVREVGELKYLDIYDGEERSESALTARVIAGDEPYHLTITYHKLNNSEPDTEALDPVEEIVGGGIDIDQLLE